MGFSLEVCILSGKSQQKHFHLNFSFSVGILLGIHIYYLSDPPYNEITAI